MAQASQEPRVVERTEQPYVAIPIQIDREEIDRAVALNDEVFGWLAARGIAPAGPPFFRYWSVGERGERFDMEVGVIVAQPVDGDGRVQPGSIPAGRYATLVHHGHPSRLMETHEALHRWMVEGGIGMALLASDDISRLAGMFELYHTDPAEQPDMAQWESEVLYLTADPG